MKGIQVFAPATIANVSCGFDVLGLALDSVGDLMILRQTEEPGIKITKISGQNLPLETENNVAGVAALAFLNAYNQQVGFEIEIEKRIKPGSGIGSSAASAAGTVWAMNELLEKPFSKLDLVRFAMEGEKLAGGTAHADNVAPALFGGFTLVRSYHPLDIVPLHTPKNLYATVVHPQIEVKTVDSRKILKSTISMEQGIRQWGNLGGLVAGLYTEDYALIGRCLQDHIVEPVRAILIPEFENIKTQSKAAGALGVGISGSGPSIFALSEGRKIAEQVAATMTQVYQKTAVPFEVHISQVNLEGIKKVKNQ